MKTFLKKIPGVRLISHVRWLFWYVYIPVVLAHFRYKRTLKRLRGAAAVRKLKVGFVIGSSSKWKAQSLYEKMLRSSEFEPIVVLTICDSASRYSAEKCVKQLDETRSFFKGRGMHCVEAYSRETGICVDLAKMGFDIVIYHQPWGVVDEQMPYNVAKRSLTFYIPYYVADYGDCRFDCDPPFNRTVYGYLTTNDAWAKVYEDYMRHKIHECRYLALGHTGLDYAAAVDMSRTDGRYIIYAPHWAFSCDAMANAENYSTFLWTGKLILEYAKRHPEQSWVFKPHPTLKQYLHETKVWDDCEIESYYAEWGKIATTCFDGDYHRYFWDSKAMVTDCGSFLMEYPCTGRPLIHLISPDCKVTPISASADYFQTFYRVVCVEDMERVFRMILEDGKDPMRENRIRKLREMKLIGNDASKNIIEYLQNLVHGRYC